MRDMPASERLAFAESVIAKISSSEEAREGRDAFAGKTPAALGWRVLNHRSRS